MWFRIAKTLTGLALALGLTACGVTERLPGAFSGPTRVALLVPEGAADARVDALAGSLVAAARMAIDESPDLQIELAVFPTAGTVEGARAAAEAALQASPRFVLGPLYGDNAAVVGSVMQPAGVPVLSFSNNPEIAGDNLFVLGQTFEDTATRLLAFAASEGRGRALALVPDNQAGTVAASAVAQAALATGVTYVGQVSYPFTQEGIQETARAAVTEIEASQPDIVVLSADAAGALPLLAQSLGESGIDTQRTRIAGLSRWDSPTSTLSLVTLSGGIFALPNIQKTTDFANRFNAFTETQPQLITGIAYDAMKIVATLTAGGSAEISREALTAPIYEGASGAFRLTDDGKTRRELAVAAADQGSYRVLSQVQIAESGF